MDMTNLLLKSGHTRATLMEQIEYLGLSLIIAKVIKCLDSKLLAQSADIFIPRNLC